MATEQRVIKYYRETEANLASTNFVLLAGQEVVVTEIPNSLTNGRKLGDGVTNYNALPFINMLRLASATSFTVYSGFAIEGNMIAIVNTAASNITVTLGAGSFVLPPNKLRMFDYIDAMWNPVEERLDIWNDYTVYSQNQIVQYQGVFVKSVQDDNINHTPDISTGGDTTWWEVVKTGGSVEVEGVLGETCSKGDVLYFGTDGLLYVAANDLLATTVVSGLAQADGSTSDPMVVVKGGLFTFDSAVLTAGVRYYLGEGGALVTRDEVADTAYLVSLGVAKSTTELDVSVGMPEWTGRQGNGKIVGEMFKMPTYRNIPGALPFAFGNAVKKALYPELWDRVGDVFKYQHETVAGEAPCAADEFWPTPIPGYYGRTGLPDINYASTDRSDNALINVTHYISRDGTPVKLIGDDIPAPLVSGTVYYVKVNSATSISFATTEANAIAGTVITLTDAGTGTFRLTQEGVEIGDAVEEHDHAMHARLSATAFGSSAPALADTTGTLQNLTTIVNNVSDASVSNETRPSTLYEFGYIQAESTLPSGETVSALRYDTGWVENSDWTNWVLELTHNLNTGLEGLKVQLFISAAVPATEPIEIAVGYTNTDSTSNWGTMVYGISDYLNQIRIVSGAQGIQYITSSGTVNVLTNQAWYYRVVVTKPNFIATVTPVPTRAITSDYTFNGMEETINVDAATATVTIDDGLSIGTKVTIRKINSGAGTVTIARSGSEVFTRASLTSVTLTSDGDFWTMEKVSSTRWELVDGVESINNSNGQGYRYKDGEQKCIATLLEDRSETGLLLTYWTFPFEFADISIEYWNEYPACVNITTGTSVPQTISPASCRYVSTTQATIYLDRSSTVNTPFHASAHGRWY